MSHSYEKTDGCFECLLEELKTAFANDHEALEKSLRVISMFTGNQVYISQRMIDRKCHVEAAASLIRSHMDYREIPSALAARFGISTNTARRVRDFANARIQA